jgi:glucose-1-phosphate adenylyltransferase
MPLSRSVTAIVLGGGRGTRLFPLTRYRSKPAVPLGGKYRLIDVPISNCIHSSVRRIYVLTQYNSASLNHHINATFRFDGFSDGFVDILAAEQTHETEQWFQGTADAVRRNLTHILGRDSSHVLIMSGDSLWRQDFRPMFQQHEESGAEVTIACKMASAEEAPGLGIVQIAADRTISGFVEKPTPQALPGLAVDPGALETCSSVPVRPETPYLASMGVYLFNRDVLWDLLTQSEDEDFGRQVIPAAIRSRKVCAHLFPGYWEDVGTIQAFYDANLSLLGDDPPYRFHDLSTPVFTRQRLLPSAEVRESTLTRAMVGEGSELEGVILRNSIVGIRSAIRRGTVLEDVVMMGADYYDGESRATPPPSGAPALGLGRDVLARRAIIDKNARVGDGCRILNEEGIPHMDSPTHSIRDGIIIIPKGAVLPPGTVI